MAGREGVRSSARLSGGAAGAGGGAADEDVGAAEREAARVAAAALRRARALRAAERAREVEDTPRVLRDKCRRLARALRDAKHLVVCQLTCPTAFSLSFVFLCCTSTVLYLKSNV